ncbi:MAG TPA: AAA family ATPase, partial [Solirubrobacteraceae bacterium]|nr:AAA family ATPase [Solirubrobacteraceae bacterium]
MERDREVAAIEQALADAREGAGGVILIEAPAGKGKSRLLTVAGDLAREAEMQVVGAHGNELEIDFPFGIAIQLFEPRWSAAEALGQRRLLEGAARHVEPLLRGDMPLPGPSPEDQAYSVIHGLFWLCTNLVSGGDPDDEPSPMVMLVDDVQWSDRPSLRFLAYLADRIADLPIALLVALRAGEEIIDRAAVTALRRVAVDRVLRPGSLSESGVDTLVTAVFPDAEPAFAQACGRVTSGNPFLLTELLRQLHRDDAQPNASTAVHLLELPPESVINSVVARLDRLPVSAQKLARTVAVLGPGVPVALVAELAELRLESAVRAADVLAAVHLFASGTQLEFVHPLVAAAVQGTISRLDCGALHRRAADVLMAHGSPAEQVAAHLMAAPPGSDPAVVESLRIAGRRALASGSAPSAVRFLERALAENPPASAHSELLAELAEAESAAGLPHALDRLEHALSLASNSDLRVRLALTQARAYYERCRYREAAAALSQALREVGADHQMVEHLEAAYIASAFFVPELEREAAARAGRLLDRIGRRPSVTQLDVL